MSSDIYLALGSNQGDREQNLLDAITRLETAGIQIIQASALYETEPVGYLDQGWFLNAVVRLETGFTPPELLDLIRRIELELGRERLIENGPRTIDLDILFWGGEVIESEDLVVPHPRLHQRLFVLQPLADVGADLIHPQLGVSVQRLLEQLDCPEQLRVFKPSFYPVLPPLPSQP